MLGQKKISAFFGSPSAKRSADEAEVNAKSPPRKICRVDTNSPEPNNNDTLALSPEQKAVIAWNREAAQQKLWSKKGPQNFGLSWKKALVVEFDKEYFQKLTNFIASERARNTVYPPEKDVFSWTQYCDIRDIKVVIIGQDPYHGPKQAHGLCFSVQPGIPAPPSLVNIFKELSNDIEGFTKPDHGYLIGWAKQGVLLLNACLTVVASQANSHKDKGWEKFTDAVIRWINKNLSRVVFMLWGAYAQKKCSFIDKNKHCILKSVHPSPLSAHRGFLGCKHFSKANDYLKKHSRKSINWDYLPIKDDAAS